MLYRHSLFYEFILFPRRGSGGQGTQGGRREGFLRSRGGRQEEGESTACLLYVLTIAASIL